MTHPGNEKYPQAMRSYIFDHSINRLGFKQIVPPYFVSSRCRCQLKSIVSYSSFDLQLVRLKCNAKTKELALMFRYFRTVPGLYIPEAFQIITWSQSFLCCPAPHSLNLIATSMFPHSCFKIKNSVLNSHSIWAEWSQKK